MKPNRQVSFRSILFKAWFSQRERAIDRFRRRPAETQERIFRQLLRRGRGTEFGWRYDLGHVRSVEQFNKLLGQFEKGSNVTLLVRRGEMQTFITIKGLNGGS